MISAIKIWDDPSSLTMSATYLIFERVQFRLYTRDILVCHRAFLHPTPNVVVDFPF
jgi:hypothetical protein